MQKFGGQGYPPYDTYKNNTKKARLNRAYFRAKFMLLKANLMAGQDKVCK